MNEGVDAVLNSRLQISTPYETVGMTRAMNLDPLGGRMGIYIESRDIPRNQIREVDKWAPVLTNSSHAVPYSRVGGMLRDLAW
jgi:hypothetical protein